MRLPVVPQISTKDGVSNKNARLTNCLKETTKRGDMAVIRPGLVLEAEGSGVGGGLVAFNNELVSVYGATLGFGPNGNELSEWTKINTQLMTGRGCVANNGSTWLQYDQNTLDGDTWVSGLDGFNEDVRTIAIGADFYSLVLGGGELIVSSDNGETWTSVDFTPAAPGSNEVLYYAGGNLYDAITDISELWVSANLGVSWTQLFPASPPGSSQAFPIMVGSTLYLFDGVNGNYEYSTDYQNFTGGSLYSSQVSIGYYENGYFYGYNFGDGSVFKTSITDMGNATILGYVPIASDPELSLSHQGQPFKIGTQSFIFGLDGVYRSSNDISPLATIATGLYDFAQSPI